MTALEKLQASIAVIGHLKDQHKSESKKKAYEAALRVTTENLR